MRIHNKALFRDSIYAQSNELTKGPHELVQHFRLQGSSHRRKSAACPKFDMVWQYRSRIPVGRSEEGGNFLVQMIFTCRRYV
jgi:hypothetical protein